MWGVGGSCCAVVGTDAVVLLHLLVGWWQKRLFQWQS